MTKAIIFDYDGVIVDSFPTVHEVYKEICIHLNVECPDSIEDFRKAYGYSKFECRKNLGIKNEDDEIFDNMFGEKVIKKEPKMFEGIDKVLKKLSKDYKLFLITSTFKEEAIQKLKKFNLFKYFDLIDGYKKNIRFSKKDMIEKAVKEFNIKKEELIYVGDRDIDYDVAKRSGIKKIIIVDYGWGHSKDKIKQKIIIEKPEDILKAIYSLNH